eukprot:753838-Hanusia_phi.AAC.6
MPPVEGTRNHPARLQSCWLCAGVTARVILHGPATVHALHYPRLNTSAAARRAGAPCSRTPAEGFAGHFKAGFRGWKRRELQGEAVDVREELGCFGDGSREILVDLRAVLDGLEATPVVDSARAVLATAQLVEEARAEFASSIHEEREVPSVASLLPPVLAQRVLAAVLRHGAHARVGIVLHRDGRDYLLLAPHAGYGSRAVAQPALGGARLAVVGTGGAGDGEEELVRLLLHLGDDKLELAGVGGGEREEGDAMLRPSAVRQVPENNLHKLTRTPSSRVPPDLLPLSLAPHLPCSWKRHGRRAEEALLEEGEEGARGHGEIEAGLLQPARPLL